MVFLSELADPADARKTVPMRIHVRLTEPPELTGEDVDERQSRGEAVASEPGRFGPNGEAVAQLLQRAARLGRAERGALAGAAFWRWWPVTIPAGGGLASARAVALFAGRSAGRGEAIAALEAAARRAFAPDVVGRAAGLPRLSRGRWAAVLATAAVAAVAVIGGVLPLSVAVVVAVVAAVALLARAGFERWTRPLAAGAVANAGLALLVRDLIEPQAFDVLSGPWREATRR